MFIKRDGVWLLTGLLVGLMLPPAMPWYIAAAGSMVAVLAGKYLLQVDGTPLLQPALIGVLVLHLLCPIFPDANAQMRPKAWPVLERGTSLETPGESNFVLPKFLRNFFGGDIRKSMERQKYTVELYSNQPIEAEAVTMPRPQDLVAEQPDRDLSCCEQKGADGDTVKAYDWLSMLMGYLPATIGASGALPLLMGIFLLIFSRAQSPLVPLTALATLGLGLLFVGWAFGQDAGARVMYGNIPIHLLSGGTLLGVFYLLPDPAVAPRSSRGKLYAGIFFGLFELFCRVVLKMSDALPLSILATQGMSFVIDQWLAPPAVTAPSSVHIGISQSSLGRL
jgi:electron transport complex protein RnfD